MPWLPALLELQKARQPQCSAQTVSMSSHLCAHWRELWGAGGFISTRGSHWCSPLLKHRPSAAIHKREARARSMRSSPRASLILVLKMHFDHLNRRADLKRKQEQKLLRETATGTAKLPVQQCYSQPAAYDEHPHSHQPVSQQHLLPLHRLPGGHTHSRTVLSSPPQHPAVCGRTYPQDMPCMSASCPAEHKPALFYCLHHAFGMRAGDAASLERRIWTETDSSRIRKGKLEDILEASGF